MTTTTIQQPSPLVLATWMSLTVLTLNIIDCLLSLTAGALHPTTGEYSYFMTTTYPWVPVYYYGSQGAEALCSAA